MERSSRDLSTTAIVPTFNRAPLVAECLKAILGQSLPPAQIIVVDDGSQDHTAETLRRFENRIEVIKMPNRGKSAGVNLALSRASHPLIWIVDDDDVVLPEALAILTGLIRSEPDAGFAYGRYHRFAVDEESRERRIFATGYWRPCAPGDFLTATLEDMFVHQPGMLVWRDCYDRVGPYDESLPRSQDYDMLIRLARIAKPVSTESAVFLQRQHEGDRGPASQRFGAGERMRRWMEADRTILQRCYAELELSEYLPDRHCKNPQHQRQALLQRGTIMARKKLWNLALQDFEVASDLGGAMLSEAEDRILKRAVLSKYGCDELFQDQRISQSIIALGKRSETGRQIARALSRGLMRRTKEQLRAARPLKAGRYAGLTLSWMLGSPRTIRSTTFPNHGSGGP